MSWDAEHPSLLLSVRLHSQLEQLLLVIFYVSYFTLLLFCTYWVTLPKLISKPQFTTCHLM